MIKSGSVESGILLGIILVLAAVGVALARRFIYGLFHGADVFVFVPADGKTLVCKNPREVIGLEDPPLDAVPPELLPADRYETYYNVCWFDSGTLIRCKHSFHRKPENALYCDMMNVGGSFIAKVVEER